MGQDNTIYTVLIKVTFSSKGQNKLKLQNQINNIGYLSKLSPLLEKDTFIENVYIVLSCPIK